nr:RNA-directed DNA polymerase, eukaryota, reverse transcriptase zinc-binding domain protein [Tanacetum cinerariifolium]
MYSNKQSGNPTLSLHKELTLPEATHEFHDSEGCNFLSEELPDIDSFNDIHPYFDDNPLSGSTTYSANSLLEEFTDELALITYPPDYDDNLTCDIKSDLREIEFLLYQGEDSDLKDSINQTDLANLNDLFVDPTPEMFTDEHAPDYSFSQRFDVYLDDFLEIESDADNFDDDLFDSKGEKIKKSELLIDQLDLPCDILSEYDSFNSQNFSRDDDLPSPDNEDKVFNPEILIHEKSVTIITRVAQEKKLAISYASLVFEDFDPPFYELLVFKAVPNSMRLHLFSSENEEKVFKPGIYTSEKVHFCFLLELSHPVWGGGGCPICMDILMVVVYAPQELRDKRILWNYLEHVINQWDGEVVIMGDFNEVRSKSERFGSVFNVQGANVFNAFIANVGLEEFPLGGSPFTWCHKSATKMSKLDRDDVLFSPDNKDKVFHPGILSHEKLVKIITHFTQEKKLAVSYASWLSEDFDPPFSEFLVFKEVPMRLLPFSSENEEKVFKPEIYTFKKKWTEKPNNVKLEFLHHFRNRFDKPTDNRVHIDMNFPNFITIDQQMDLECAVSKEELKRAVWECGTDKSPGPDGFSFGFYRQFWSSIENDVFATVSHFFTFGDIPNGCNSCFIALIPKVPDANLVKDFRPISLIGSMYKIIAKILTNRLVGVLGDIVNEKKQSLIFKVDFEKAYDSVRWDFLDDVLKKFGFGNKWCAWIQSCLRSSRGSIIINGSPTEEFQFFKGLKQGINLSPLVNLSHMFYADNAVFVGQWCDSNINTLVHVLECLFQASGLRINMCKKSIRCYFFIGHELNSNKASWVRWKSVLASKEKGGLGVSSLYALNRGLMMKWVWRFYSKKESLWARVIKAIYGDDGQVRKVSKAGSRSCWRNIVNEVRILSNQGIKVLDYMLIKLGNEESMAFWDDNWIGGKVLKLENSLRRSIRGGVEQVQFNELSDMLQSVSLMPYSDRWVWSLKGSGEFFVASIRKIIDDTRLSTVDTRTLWIKYVPIKVNVLAWKIKIEALPIRFDISRRGVFYVVWWHVWTFRNKLLFEDKKPSKAIIFDDVVSRSYYWCKFRCKASFSWDDWLKIPNMISL